MVYLNNKKSLLTIFIGIITIVGCKTPTKAPTLTLVKTLDLDTIPFKIGKDNGIHVKGTINNSRPLDFIFDTGANAFVVSSSIIGKKVDIKIDGQALNNGAGGTTTMDISTDDKIKIGALKWENNPIISIPYNNPKFDCVFGLNAFQNKIIEIDYDISKLIIHNTVQTIPSGYRKQESKKEFGLFFLKALADADGNQSEDWFMYDTGCNSNLVLSQDFAIKQNLNNTMDTLGTATYSGSAGVPLIANSYKLPEFKIDNNSLYNVLIDINEKDLPGAHSFNVLGNGLMKHFNIIIDLKNDAIYIKPNKLFKTPEPYKN